MIPKSLFVNNISEKDRIEREIINLQNLLEELKSFPPTEIEVGDVVQYRFGQNDYCFYKVLEIDGWKYKLSRGRDSHKEAREEMLDNLDGMTNPMLEKLVRVIKR